MSTTVNCYHIVVYHFDFHFFRIRPMNHLPVKNIRALVRTTISFQYTKKYFFYNLF